MLDASIASDISGINKFPTSLKSASNDYLDFLFRSRLSLYWVTVTYHSYKAQIHPNLKNDSREDVSKDYLANLDTIQKLAIRLIGYSLLQTPFTRWSIVESSPFFPLLIDTIMTCASIRLWQKFHQKHALHVARQSMIYNTSLLSNWMFRTSMYIPMTSKD